MKLYSKYLIILILMLTAFLRFYRLDYPKGYVFDEVYHAFTAKEYALNNPKAWEWWNTPPSGVAYEWTHPPLAKEIMALSMIIFGSMDSWAWRFPGALLGVLAVLLVYALAKKIFHKEIIALIAAFLFSLDGLNFVQSRTGMNDMYFVTFMLACIYFFLRKSLILSAIFLGLSLASKWSALYTLPLIFLFLVKERKILNFLPFLIIPPLVYLASYIPFFLLGHSFDQFIQLQQQIWWYHTGLKATHSYTSAWWSWPLNLYPVWYFVEYKEDQMANIFASGNPLLFWSGSIALILTLFESIKKKSFNLFIPVLGFLVFLLPWAFSPRIMFLYHFAPCTPFLSLALGYQLGRNWEDNKTFKLVVLLLVLISLSFLLIYPYLTGVFLPKNYINLFFSTNLSSNPF
ncbi:glycosyltransferase family 39 protein [Candidatus Daviesbacteria bacterium]|nr:glycosyltransferase family 39 protein [Candidatus Daviesbacteria bacterium]